MQTQPAWKRYLTEYNEGLGLVYERFVLNDFLLELKGRYAFQSVLEAPLYGMAGVSGINSVALARAHSSVTLVDDNPERLAGVRQIRGELGLTATFVPVDDWSHLPFPDRSFDLTWNWAALWHLADPGDFLRELVRCANDYVFVAVPNPAQVGYLMRKYVVEPEFVREVQERWTDTRLIARQLAWLGVEIVDEGVLDVPPWPDTVMPASDLLHRLGIRSASPGGPLHRQRLAMVDDGLLPGSTTRSLSPRHEICLAGADALAAPDQAALGASPLDTGAPAAGERMMPGLRLNVGCRLVIPLPA